jgi:RNA polymerase sigma factor (sigma-70 family)
MVRCVGAMAITGNFQPPAGENSSVEVESDAATIAASFEDSERFGVLFDRHATVIYRYLVRRVGVDEADTLLGETFAVAFERRATYDCTRTEARPWLYGIATNLLAHHRRSEARRLAATARLRAHSPGAEDAFGPVVKALTVADVWLRTARAITELSTEERDVMILRAWEELSYEEIATALGVPVGTVRSRLSRARTHLRELVPPDGREP